MTKSPVTIRSLRPEDRDSLLGVITSDTVFTQEEISVATELIDEAIASTKDYEILVAEMEGTKESPSGSIVTNNCMGVIGYVCFGAVPMTENAYDLYWIVVHGNARGKGAASSLMRCMETELKKRGGRAVRIETSQQESHGSARRLYEKNGYELAATLPNFYKQGDGLLTYYKQW